MGLFLMSAADKNLTSRVSAFLDPHLIVPLLDFLIEKEVFPKNDLLAAKSNVLAKTGRYEAQKQTAQLLNRDAAGLDEKDAQSQKNLQELEAKCATLRQWMGQNAEEIEKLKAEKKFNTAYLKKEHSIPESEVTALFQLAKAQFERGQYAESAQSLTSVLPLSVNAEGTKNNEYFKAMWGKLAANILTQSWEAASADIDELKEMIDTGKFGTPLDQLQQRSWLAHWSLFVAFQLPSGAGKLVELCFHYTYLNALQNTSPHFLRYLAVAVIIYSGERRRFLLQDLARVVKQEHNNFQDPITNFVHSLLVDFHFDDAVSKVEACREIISQDYFLHGQVDTFDQSARLFILETYCRIHENVALEDLAKRFGMADANQVQVWVETLNKNARLDAKVEDGRVKMQSKKVPAHEQVMKRTKALYQKSNYLTRMVNSLDAPASSEVAAASS